MEIVNPALFLFNEPVKIYNKVSITVPKIKDVISSKEYGIYSRIFTMQTREIFVLERQVDALEQKYPTVWEFMWDEQANNSFGKLFDDTGKKTFTDVIFNGLSYWTGLNVDGKDENGSPTGFVKLGNQKLMHVSAEWIIDKDEFVSFCRLIRYITAWKPSENLAPTITSDVKHQRWVKHYKRAMKYQKGRNTTWADKILIMSSIGDSYIPPSDIKDMTIFHFNYLYNAFIMKQSYNLEFGIFVSPKFMPKTGTKVSAPQDWKGKFNTGYNKVIDGKDE